MRHTCWGEERGKAKGTRAGSPDPAPCWLSWPAFWKNCSLCANDVLGLSSHTPSAAAVVCRCLASRGWMPKSFFGSSAGGFGCVVSPAPSFLSALLPVSPDVAFTRRSSLKTPLVISKSRSCMGAAATRSDFIPLDRPIASLGSTLHSLGVDGIPAISLPCPPPSRLPLHPPTQPLLKKHGTRSAQEPN